MNPRQAPRVRPGASRAPSRPPPRKNQSSGIAYNLIVWLLIVYVSVPWDIFDAVKLDSPDAMTTGNALGRFIKLGFIAVSLGIIGSRWKLASQVFKGVNRGLLAFLILVPLSFLWSIEPGATIARFVSLLCFALVCVAFALGPWRPERFQEAVRPVVTLLLVGSLIFGVVDHDLAIEHGEGTLKEAWHGLLGQKNQLGQLASVGMILWLHAFVSKQTSRLLAVLGMGVSMLLLLLSRSSSSLLATVFACALQLMMLQMPVALRRYVPYIVGIFTTVVIIYAVAILKLVAGLDIVLLPIVAITGKDLTFSNRSEIWAIVKEHIQYAPLLGSGYGAYWTGPMPTSPSYVFLGRMYFYPTESHNGYLEITNDLGFVGLVVLLYYLMVYVRQSLQLWRFDRLQAGLFISLFFHQLIGNLTETSWLAISGPLMTIIMSCATIMIARGLLEHRQAAALRAPPAKGAKTQRHAVLRPR